MAVFNKRLASFGREDRSSGIRAFLRSDSIVIRLIVFIVMSGIFYLVVQATHKAPRNTTEPPQSEQPAGEKQPATK
ncbi:MAG: hypothetical protein JSS75_11635 [Bacteroidetes bacterium]|nr:hypothetical protein [Bacteroidota bacterium]